MTERSLQYGKVLFELGLDEDVIAKTREIFKVSKELSEALDNPAIHMQEKHRVLERLLDSSILGFVKVVCDHQMSSHMDEIFAAYDMCVIENKNWVRATLYYVTMPSDEQLEQMKAKIQKEYNKDGVELELIEQPSLIGGFVLKVHDFETDRSVKGRLEQLTQNLMRR